MNQHLQIILNFIQQAEHLTTEEKASLTKAVKDTDSELTISAFKLERTEKVKRTTAILLEQTIEELEHKRKAVEAQNRELEIESSLERVRTMAMSMKQPDDLLGICEVLFTELQKLGFSELRNTMINIYDDDKGSFLNYDFSEDAGKTITSHFYNSHPVIENQVKQVRSSNNAFSETIFTGKELDDWREFRKRKGEPDDPKVDNITSLFYYFYSIGIGAIGISTFSSITEEKKNVLKRFRNVFDLAYRRYIDITKAEAQARESQIELGLERVRARAMAMQSSYELSELVDTVFKELTKLDFALTWCIINIIDESSLTNTVWAANPDIDKAPESYYMKFEDYPFHHAMMKGWKERKTKYVYVLEGLEKKVYDEYLFNETEFRKVPEAAQAASRAIEKYVCSFSFSNFGGLQTVGDLPLSDENLDILSRFGKVFDLTYTRFNDLKQAEAQARESQIQLAMERVRARTMAMQKSEELSETAVEMFKQVKALGVHTFSCGFHIFEKEEKAVTEWMSDPSGSYGVSNKIPLTEDLLFIRIREARQRNLDFVALESSGKELQETIQYMSDLPDRKEVMDKFLNSGFQLPTFQITHCAFFSQGYLMFITVEPAPDAHDIFKRFAKVFEQTYTRFLDLQKAEAQAREAQIEAALERVRSRTMAMQRSADLQDASLLLFQQVQALGIPPFAFGFNIWDDDKKAATAWMGSVQGLQPPFKTSSAEDIYLPIYEAAQRGEFLFVKEQAGKELEIHYQYLATIPVFRDIIMVNWSKAGVSFPTFQIIHCAFFSQGYLMFITYEPVTAAYDIFKRFAKVFEQTYTRFLDLQKAEAQAREAQIEAALERVRSRSMAMQNSDELAELVATVFKELNRLEFALTSCIIWINNPESLTAEMWVASTEMNKPPEPYYIKPFRHPYFKSVLNAWKEKNKKWVYEMKGEEKKIFQQTFFNEVDSFPSIIKKALEAPESVVYSASFYNFGALEIVATEKVTDKKFEILHRLGKVFDMSYTRFNDLKQAEAQAREAKTEAALERVRSRSMSMQKSNELREVIQVIYEQLLQLNFTIDSAGFNMDIQESDDWNLWMADRYAPYPTKIHIPYFDHPLTNAIIEAKKSGAEKMVLSLTFEEKNTMLDNSFKYVQAPQEAKEMLFSLPGYVISEVFFKDVALYIQNYTGTLYTDAENATLIRFGKVFEQTYIRFNDLKQAESQAMEAIKRASVDRVRAEIASMRTTTDLQRIQPLIWNELTTLGVPFIRCGVFIMDEEQQQVQTLLSTPEGKAIATLHVPFEFNLSIITNGVSHWRKREIYKEHWDAATFTKAWITLSSLRETSMDSPQTEHPPENLYLHMLPFLQGMLYVGNDAPLNEDELQLVQNLADAFSTAYARYEDFNKLESANIKIEKTLVDLKQAQAQLVQSEKMASLGELTAGIAHEIQNPLNFVNNFSEVNAELIEEMKTELKEGNNEDAIAIANDIADNEQKIIHHGKRADAIVKGMLMHSRSSTGQKEPTEINALADEYLRLSYHGLRAKDKSFNATMKTDYDETIGKINIIPQDIGRVILNLITNAFYVVDEKKKQQSAGQADYEPTVSVSTKKINGKVEIKVKDNGNGIPQKVLDKIFQPFFTTKPTGEGTGLGLSLSYDIIKAHGGEIKVETKEGEGAEFIIELPVA